MQSIDIEHEGIAPFKLSVKYIDYVPKKPEDYPISHVHSQCEVYINLSGDVSFVVENSIYPISPGSVIITRPFEYHHCIYHSNVQHKHFWILFSAEKNERLLDMFFRRHPGENNLLVLLPNDLEELTSLCHAMIDTSMDDLEKVFSFLKMLHLLKGAAAPAPATVNFSDDVRFAMKYIGDHFAESISIKKIANLSNVSINSLERHFVKSLGMTPSAYIKKKRLANATKLLSGGSSVMEACAQSGFTDYCGFISLFRENYGITPLVYKKALVEKPR